MKLLLVFIITFLLMCSTTIARDVTLAWDKNTEDSLAGYRIFARESSESYDYSQPEWEGITTTCTLDDFDEYEDYYFVARAFDDEGNESADSNEVVLTKLEEDDINTPENSGKSGSSGCFISTIEE